MNLQKGKRLCIGRVICASPLPQEGVGGIFIMFRADEVLIRARKIIPFSGWQATRERFGPVSLAAPC
jgi:hypothetical protein